MKDRAMLRQKEIEDLANMEKLRRDKDAAFAHKRVSSIFLNNLTFFRIYKNKWLKEKD